MQDLDTLIKNKNDFLNQLKKGSDKGFDTFPIKIRYSIGRTHFELCSECASVMSEVDEADFHLIDHNQPDPYAFVPYRKHIITMDWSFPGYHSNFIFNEQDVVSVEKRTITKGKKEKVIAEKYYIGILDTTEKTNELNKWVVNVVEITFPMGKE